MHVGRFAKWLKYSLVGGALVAGSAWPSKALAQDDHMSSSTPHHEQTPEQKRQASALVRKVREVTERFRDPAAAVGEHYELTFGCVSGGDLGAMGIHLVNFPLVFDKVIDPNQPDVLIYEPTPGGGLRLTGADYLVLAADWAKNHPNPLDTPQLMGQLFHLFDAPNRFGLPAFYTLHVWAWKDNPNGTFANWNPNVSCNAYNPQP
jgi:hypothetical protein